MTYLLDEPPAPAPEPTPPDAQAEGADARGARVRRAIRRAAPIVLGAGLMLVGILAWSSLQPRTTPLTRGDVARRDRVGARVPDPAPGPRRGRLRGGPAVARPHRVRGRRSRRAHRRRPGHGRRRHRRGEILTALHVVADAETITVRFADGTRAEATIASADEENDIAVLQPRQRARRRRPGGARQPGRAARSAARRSSSATRSGSTAR